MAQIADLSERGVLVVGGPDRIDFLQGLVTNDMRKLAPDRALFAAFLTPQGKFLHDFFVVDQGETVLLDCEGPRRDDLLRRLKVYRLRSRVELADGTRDWSVSALFGPGTTQLFGLAQEPGVALPFAGGVSYVDPRMAALGIRLIRPRLVTRPALAAEPAEPADYDRHRLALGVPAGSADLAVEKAILLESNYDELHAIAWDKGCYLGQELTARTKYRGLVKKRLVPVAVDGRLPEPGTPILAGDKPVGELRSGRGSRAIGLIRLDALTARGLRAGTAGITPLDPGWLRPLSSAPRAG